MYKYLTQILILFAKCQTPKSCAITLCNGTTFISINYDLIFEYVHFLYLKFINVMRPVNLMIWEFLFKPSVSGYMSS